MANLYAVHRDENTWENPDQFNPSRFLDSEGKVHSREQLISFGLGRYSSPTLRMILKKNEGLGHINVKGQGQQNQKCQNCSDEAHLTMLHCL